LCFHKLSIRFRFYERRDEMLQIEKAPVLELHQRRHWLRYRRRHQRRHRRRNRRRHRRRHRRRNRRRQHPGNPHRDRRARTIHLHNVDCSIHFTESLQSLKNTDFMSQYISIVVMTALLCVGPLQYLKLARKLCVFYPRKQPCRSFSLDFSYA
jgi:hypothetical protein